LRDPAERVGDGERAVELGLDDRIDVAWFVAAGVADGLLALRVGPAGAVRDQVAVVAREQVADDPLERVQLGVAGLDQAGADVVSEPEVAAGGLGVPARACAVASSRRARRSRPPRGDRGGVVELLVDKVAA
jgi:hypothetical protein